MGFGLLLVGYTVAYLFSIGLGGLENYAFAGYLVGYFLCYMGLSELKKYSPKFFYALVISICLTACGFFETLAGLDNLLSLGLNISSNSVYTALGYVRFFLDLIFNISLLYGIIDISKRVDYEPTRNAAYRNLIFVVIAYAFEIFRMAASMLAYDSIKSYMSAILAASVIVKIFYIFLNVLTIFKCYAFICPSEDVDMKRKESKVGFINKLHERNEQKEKENMELSRKFYEDRLKKKSEKAKSKKKKKK